MASNVDNLKERLRKKIDGLAKQRKGDQEQDVENNKARFADKQQMWKAQRQASERSYHNNKVKNKEEHQIGYQRKQRHR